MVSGASLWRENGGYRPISPDLEIWKGAISDDELDLSQASEASPGLRPVQQRAAAKATWRVTLSPERPNVRPEKRGECGLGKGEWWFITGVDPFVGVG